MAQPRNKYFISIRLQAPEYSYGVVRVEVSGEWETQHADVEIDNGYGAVDFDMNNLPPNTTYGIRVFYEGSVIASVTNQMRGTEASKSFTITIPEGVLPVREQQTTYRHNFLIHADKGATGVNDIELRIITDVTNSEGMTNTITKDLSLHFGNDDAVEVSFNIDMSDVNTYNIRYEIMNDEAKDMFYIRPETETIDENNIDQTSHTIMIIPKVNYFTLKFSGWVPPFTDVITYKIYVRDEKTGNVRVINRNASNFIVIGGNKYDKFAIENLKNDRNYAIWFDTGGKYVVKAFGGYITEENPFILETRGGTWEEELMSFWLIPKAVIYLTIHYDDTRFTGRSVSYELRLNDELIRTGNHSITTTPESKKQKFIISKLPPGEYNIKFRITGSTVPVLNPDHSITVRVVASPSSTDQIEIKKDIIMLVKNECENGEVKCEGKTLYKCKNRIWVVEELNSEQCIEQNNQGGEEPPEEPEQPPAICKEGEQKCMLGTLFVCKDGVWQSTGKKCGGESGGEGEGGEENKTALAGFTVSKTFAIGSILSLLIYLITHRR